MYKIISGIIAILCLQITFQVYNAIERTDAAYASIQAIDGQTISVRSQRLELADLPASGAEFASVMPIRRIAAPRHRPIARPMASNAILVSIKRSPPRLKPLQIHKGATVIPAFTTTAASKPLRSRVYDGTAVDEDHREKRSLIAKVVKKPYDWLKAVGSKLF